jgi:hypothetical protein
MHSIQTASPADIDAEIFALLQRLWATESRLVGLVGQAHRVAGDRQRHSYGRSPMWDMLDSEAWDKVEAIAAREQGDYRVRNAQEIIAKRDEYLLQMQNLRDEIAPLTAEYVRRGGWTRAYLVDNADGHVHKTDNCSSFRVGTHYHWLTELSGQAETEIVELAGERACTICYPSAPVDVLKRPSKLEGPAQAAAREAKAKRDAEKAVRDAKKAEKAIANPDGSPLRGKWGVIKTTVTAWNELVDDIFTSLYYGYDLHAEINDRITAALMHKTGQSKAEILNALQAKVAAKAKREKVTL